MKPSLIVTLALSNLVQALDPTTLTHFLIQRADAEFPMLKRMGQDIYHNPELGNGAFDGFELALMAHPTSASSVQVMEGRINSFYSITGSTHAEAVKKAYSAMVIIDHIHDDLPGKGSTAVSIANIGDYATNVIQQNISLGFAGAEKRTVEQIVSKLLSSGTFPKVNASITEDQDGVVLAALGPGGHASEFTRGALELTTATFEALSNDSSSIGSLARDVSHDIVYPSLEIIPSLANAFVNLIEEPEYGLTDFVIGPDIAASTDASWCELPVLDPETHELISVKRAILHANYRICEKVSGALCAFNHEPLFHNVSGTDFAYEQTKIVAIAEAQLIVEALSNDTFYEELTALVV
ncbi:unnamed protein product [Fusarium equiseti]|uniref:Uncharacterized protein n=1 Tax=Fusarium equiseti TaxID=61235 RepID=A0A8J2N9V6_FUSEQ|nr:unnamed protein product [Fusarium equiseti]